MMIIHLLRDRYHNVIAPMLMVIILGVCVGSINLSIELENADLLSLEIDFDSELEEDRLSDDKINDPSDAYQHLFMMSEDPMSRFNQAAQLVATLYLSISTPPPDLEVHTLLS